MGAVFSNQLSARTTFVGDGTRTDFPFDFDVFDAGDVEIRIDGAVIETGFHIALTAQDGVTGGTVTFEVPPAVGSAVTVARVLRLRRLSSYDAMSLPRSDAIERDLDFITLALGDVDRALAGTVRFGSSETYSASAELPAIEPGRSLIWNATGDGFANGPAADDISTAASQAARASDAANVAEAASTRAQNASQAFVQSDAGAFLDLDFRSQNLLAWEDERKSPVIDAPVSRIMDVRETGALVRLSSGARLTLPSASIARNGVRYRVFNGDGTLVDIASASGDVIAPINGGADRGVYPLPTRGDMVDLICDGVQGGRWFAAPVHETGPLIKLLRTSAQSIPAGGAFLIEWDQVIEDSHGLYDGAVHGITDLAPGFYQVDVGVCFPVTAEAVMTTLSLERFNGAIWSSHLQSNDLVSAGINAAQSLRLSGIARIDATPATGLRVRLAHSDSQTRDIGQSDVLSWCHLHRIGG